MVIPGSDSDARFGEFAVRFGGVSESQLQRALALWNNQQSRPLGEVLVELGALTDESRRILETRWATQLSQEADESDGSNPNVSAADSQATMDFPPQNTTSTTDTGPVADSSHRFQRTQLHAEGGLGAVYEAHDRELNRTVALKEIKGRYADDMDSRERFTKEAEITGRLEHPGIVPVYALGRYADGRPYYAMRFIRGRSMRDAIEEFYQDETLSRQDRELGMRSLLGNLIDVCEAVYYAHRRGIVHRDIKPSNIMLGDYGETLVVDWGLAKNLGRRETSTASIVPNERTLMPASGSSVTETMVGRAIGSPAFMSPEQARGEHETVDFASDVYGLGATLYMILTGCPPVEGGNTIEILANVRKGEIDRPRKLDRSIPKSVEAVCMRALSFEAHDRYTSVRDLQRDVERYLADEPVTARHEPWFERCSRTVRKRRWLWPVIVAGFVGAFAVTLALQSSERRHQRSLTAAAEEKQRELQHAYNLTAEAFETIDPFADIDTNVKRLQDAAQRIKTSDVPTQAKAWSYDAIVAQFERFKRPESATPWAEESLKISRELLGDDDPETRHRQQMLAQILHIDGEYEQATRLLEQLVEYTEGKEDSEHFAYLQNLAALYSQLDEPEKALACQRKVLSHRQETLGPDDLSTIQAEFELGRQLSLNGQYVEADRILNRVYDAVAVAKQLPPENRLAMMQVRYTNLLRQKKFQEALSGFEQLLPEYVDQLGIDHDRTLSMQANIANVQEKLHRFEESIQNYKAIIAERKRSLGDGHEKVWQSQLNLGVSLLGAGKFDEAVSETEPWLARYRQRELKRYYVHAGTRTVAFAFIALERYEELKEVMHKWLSDEDSRKPEINFSRALAAGELALAQRNIGLADESVATARALLDEFDCTPGDEAGLRSLQGAIYLKLNELDHADDELNEAQRLLATEPKSLKAHQMFWPKRVADRLAALNQNRSGKE